MSGDVSAVACRQGVRALWAESGMLLNISRCTGGSPAAQHYGNGAKVEERQWLLYKSKAHIDFHFLRGSGGLG